MTGEFRFRAGYCKSNPRKMVKTWAEKEMRNLMRCAWVARRDAVVPPPHARSRMPTPSLHKAGIPSPQPIALRSHVLIMQFLGKKGWCAAARPPPRLRPPHCMLSVAGRWQARAASEGC